MWADAGFLCIQAKTEQRPTDGSRPTPLTRLLKGLERNWRRLTERRIVYLERNCRLEIAQTDALQPMLDRCLADVRTAWRRGEPAIIETHRVNFAHVDPEVTKRSLTAFSTLLDSLVSDPAGRPLFLTDSEIAMLERTGTSFRRFGKTWILRNLTNSSRIVNLPATETRPVRSMVLSPGTALYNEE